MLLARICDSQQRDQPNLLDPQAVGLFKEIQEAVQLRFSLAAQEAFNAGYTMIVGVYLPGNLSEDDSERTLLFILRRALPLLYLPGTILEYIQQVLDQFERGEVSTPQFVGFLALFNLYIDSRVVKSNPKIISFFEADQPAMAKPGPLEKMRALLGEVADTGDGSADTGDGSADTGDGSADTGDGSADTGEGSADVSGAPPAPQAPTPAIDDSGPADSTATSPDAPARSPSREPSARQPDE